jgi:sulfur-carrier protein adenylyltransferase/sulfurtransferase
MDVAELKDRLDRGRLDLVDVREPFEWRIANLGAYGAAHDPHGGGGGDRLDELDPEREIVLYCRSGARSGGLGRYLRAHGYPRVRNLEGGILAWSDEVDPGTQKY